MPSSLPLSTPPLRSPVWRWGLGGLLLGLLLLLLGLPSGRAGWAGGPSEVLRVPQRTDFLSHLSSAEAHQQEAEALGAALGRVHNHLAQGDRLRCEAPDAPSLAWRAELLGQAWRDALQSTRAEAERLRRMHAAPTVAPLLGAEEEGRLAALEAALAASTQAWQAAAGWQKTYIAPWAARCPWTTPEALPGLPSSAPTTRAEARLPIAILAVGAVLCPQKRALPTPAGVAVVLSEPRACMAPDMGCSCTPQEVLPGAVLRAIP